MIEARADEGRFLRQRLEDGPRPRVNDLDSLLPVSVEQQHHTVRLRGRQHREGKLAHLDELAGRVEQRARGQALRTGVELIALSNRSGRLGPAGRGRQRESCEQEAESHTAASAAHGVEGGTILPGSRPA